MKPPAKERPSPVRAPKERSLEGSTDAQVAAVLAWLKAHGKQTTVDGMARYGIPSERAVGVGVGELRAYAKGLGPRHALAVALWDTGGYEARMLTAYLGVAGELTGAQMDRWWLEFDNWSHVDTLCFHLFDRSPLAWERVRPWSRHEGEFQRRAAFALLWSLALHDKGASDEQFAEGLALIERTSEDPRNFVKKAVAMALGAIGRRPSMKAAVTALAERLAASPQAPARWIGRDALQAGRRASSKTAVP